MKAPQRKNSPSNFPADVNAGGAHWGGEKQPDKQIECVALTIPINPRHCQIIRTAKHSNPHPECDLCEVQTP